MCLWERNVIRASDYKNHRIFALKCIGQNLIPVSIKLKPIKSKQNISTSARKIIERAERQLMQDRIRGINSKIQASKDNGNHNKTRLASIVTWVDLDRCVSFIEKVRQDRFNNVIARRVGKVDILGNKNKPNQGSNHSSNNNNNRPTQGGNAASLDNNNQSASEKDINKWVIKLSKPELTPAQKSLPVKGPNFAISPNNIPNLEYITAIESMCPKLKEEDASELRANINALLRKGKEPKPNLNKQERIALLQLKKDQARIILTVNKGVALVVLDKEDYINKGQGLLSQPAYKEIPKDPTNRIKAQPITKLRRIKKDSNIYEGTYKAMYPTGCVPPKFYGLP